MLPIISAVTVARTFPSSRFDHLRERSMLVHTVVRFISAFWVLMLLSAAPASAAEPAGVGDLALTVNDQRALDVTGQPTRVLVADPAVADVQLLRSGSGRAAAIMVVGKKPGSTTVQVWVRGERDPRVSRVTVQGSLQSALPPLDGLATTLHGDAALISGRASSLLAHRAETAGAVDAVGADKVLDGSVVGPGGVVQVEVKVVEMSRNVLKDVGVSLGASNTRGGFSYGMAGGGIVGNAWNIGASLVRGAFNLDVTLSLLQNNGLARVLAEPTLLALSGQSASFLAGGEIPIPSSGSLGTQNVEYKPFGIGLTVTPTILAADRIALKVAPEASELDWANAIPVSSGSSTSLIPALRTRRADTMVELGDGESFVIGGLVSRTTMASVDKLPLLGDLPIIGAFFRSMNYTQEEKELVIVVTPRLVRPIARGANLPLPGEQAERIDTATTAWGHYLLGPLGGEELPGFSR